MNGKAPFDGWMTRKSSGKQVEQAMVSFHFCRTPPPSHSTRGQLRHIVECGAPLKLTNLDNMRTQAGDTNPFTLRPHSKKYQDIFEVRKKLPVHQQMNEFLEMFNGPSQFIVLSGETGSGKTTQCVPPGPIRSFSRLPAKPALMRLTTD